ncbi:plasmid mobilization relaxosome protein MobC [Brevundimonas diminuta]|uniref:plasmid mobilization relaxosome protein MobC n=1 Tax=Brevundimonas diminuta TaxID=293 RepID=UPI0030F58BB1
MRDRPQFSRADALALIGVRRIGVNVNQIARALNTAVMEDTVLDLELAQLGAFQAEIAAWVEALGEAFVGNLSYWGVRP